MTEGVLAFLGVPRDEGERRVYLCHAYCEMGATEAAAAFRRIHDYLRENPNEVIVLVLEDHVDAADAIQALERGGLARRALVWSPGDPLPTLGQMIEQRRNVVVLAENEGGAAPWYLPAFDVLQETPFRFETAGDFSCGTGRGSPDNPLLLVNHWLTIDPPNSGAAAEVNAADVLPRSASRRVSTSAGGRTSWPSTSTPTATCSTSSTSSTGSPRHPRTDRRVAGRLAGLWRPIER